MGATARAVSRSAQPRWGRAPSEHYFRTIAARACPLADRKKDTKPSDCKKDTLLAQFKYLGLKSAEVPIQFKYLGLKSAEVPIQSLGLSVSRLLLLFRCTARRCECRSFV